MNPRNFLLVLIFINYTSAFSTDLLPSETDIWTKAISAIQSQDQGQIKTTDSQLKGKFAPKAFFTSQSQKYEGETEKDYKKRTLLPELLCTVGWNGALFLTSSGNVFGQLFPGHTLPRSLNGKAAKMVLQTRFVDLETAAENGQLGAVLYFLSTRHPNNTCNFANGLFKYCQKNGYGNFAQYVLNHLRVFFGDVRGSAREQINQWEAQCFSTAFVVDLREKGSSSLETESEMTKFSKLCLSKAAIDTLYAEAAKRSRYPLMDRLLDHPDWSKPSIEAENFALQTVLGLGDFARAISMLAPSKKGRKPNKVAVDVFTSQQARAGNWVTVERVIHEIYVPDVITTTQELSDSLYVCAAAYEHRPMLTLIEGITWPRNPTQEAKNDAFSHACMNDRDALIAEFILGFSASAEFDHALVETVKYRKQTQFDDLLNTHRTQLSDVGLRSALEQAGKPSERRSRLGFDLSEALVIFKDNHYQKRLKEILGISPTRIPEYTIAPNVRLDNFNITPPQIDFFQFFPADEE